MSATTGSRIKQLRERRDWSQLFLAKKVGINNSVLSRIEADKRPVESELLNKFAEVFSVSADFLLGRSERKQTNPNEVSKNEHIIKEIVQKYNIDLTGPGTKEKIEKIIELVISDIESKEDK